MGGWFIGQHRATGLAWVLAGAAVMMAVGLVGAGMDGMLEYVGIFGAIPPSVSSLAGLTGIGWLCTVALGAGTLVSALLWRQPRASFVVAVTTMTLASPAFQLTTLTILLGALAPIIPEAATTLDTSRRLRPSLAAGLGHQTFPARLRRVRGASGGSAQVS